MELLEELLVELHVEPQGGGEQGEYNTAVKVSRCSSRTHRQLENVYNRLRTGDEYSSVKSSSPFINTIRGTARNWYARK